MNKTELISAIAKKTGLNLKQAGKTLEAVMESITQSLRQGKRIILINFGSFIVKKRAARKGIHPQTREPINIPAKKVVVFRAGKKLKEVINKGK